MANCLIVLGANLGEREATLRRAIDLLADDAQTRVVAVSKFHETAPVGGPRDQPSFLNAAARIETSHSPIEVAKQLQQIEQACGRTRLQRWSARTLDLDLLLYDEQVITSPELDVPHPRMAFRKFVLAPANEVAPDMRHPVIGWTVGELFQHLLEAPPLVAVTGSLVGRTALAGRLAEAGARLLDFRGGAGLFVEKHSAQEHGALLEERRFALAASRLKWKDSPIVATFWLREQRAAAQLDLSEGELAEFDAALSEVESAGIRPKLLIVVRPASRDVLDSAAAARRAAIEDAIVELANAPGHGPTLWVNDDDLDGAVSEAKAAIEAMGP